MTTYMVCDENGNALTAGLQECEAARVAQYMANRLGRSVWLSASDGSEMEEEFSPEYTAEDLVLCRSDQGDGGWSLHPPGTTDEQIASGDAPCLISGTAEKDEAGEWSGPDDQDYWIALRALANRS